MPLFRRKAFENQNLQWNDVVGHVAALPEDAVHMLTLADVELGVASICPSKHLHNSLFLVHQDFPKKPEVVFAEKELQFRTVLGFG